MTKGNIMVELEKRNDRSAWDRGVTEYCFDLLDNVQYNETPTKEKLLGGADSWQQYSYGGCALIYDCDIAERLCCPSELKKRNGGERNPNQYETWLDVQARALYQACNRVMKLARKEG